MFKIMDEMCELIYVADINTYELLFVNSPGKASLGIGDEYIGQKCYRLLQGRNEPCPFCTNSLLKENEVYTWEFYNPLVGRHFLLKDKQIEWEGRTSRIEIAFDMTESEQEKQRLKNVVESERVIMDCIRMLYQSDNLEKALPQILERFGRFLDAERSYFFEIVDHRMYNKYEWCADGVMSQQEYLQGLDESLLTSWRAAFDKNECYIIEDVEHLRETDAEVYEVLKLQNVHSLVAAPLEQDGRLIGYIGVDNPPQEKIDSSSMLFYTLQYFLMASIRREADEKLLTQLSYHDPLTGAYNRNRYTKDMQELYMRKTAVGIVYLDINGLKDINDQWGHAFGDQVIKEFALQVVSVFGLSQLYRIGGDEFVVLCKNVTQEDFYEKLAKLKLVISGAQHYSAAIGYQWSESSRELARDVSRADAMMYEEKKKHYRGHEASNRYRHHNDELLGLNNPETLRIDLDENRFVVYLQPKVLIGTRKLVGAEALVRYRNRENEIVVPDQFLPLLEKLQLIHMVDFYVFDKVCHMIAGWQKQGKRIVPISVNFSRSTISASDYIQRLKEICNKYEVDASFLEIEITESAECKDDFDLKRFAEQMRAAGFLVSIDDFGVDYANFSILTSMDVCKLKLDKSLITTVSSDEKTQRVVRALMDMCQNLNIKITVEGVETEQQAQILPTMGTGEAQGYLFGHPVPIEEFEEKYL